LANQEVLDAFKQKILEKESEISKKDKLLTQATQSLSRLQLQLQDYVSNTTAKQLEQENARLLQVQYERDKQHRIELKQLEERLLTQIDALQSQQSELS